MTDNVIRKMKQGMYFRLLEKLRSFASFEVTVTKTSDEVCDKLVTSVREVFHLEFFGINEAIKFQIAFPSS